MITTINGKKVRMSEEKYQQLCRIAKARNLTTIEQVLNYL